MYIYIYIQRERDIERERYTQSNIRVGNIFSMIQILRSSQQHEAGDGLAGLRLCEKTWVFRDVVLQDAGLQNTY